MSEAIDYIEFFTINIFVFRVLGFWKPHQNMSYKNLYNLYTAVCVTSWFLFLLSQAIYIISLDDIAELTTVGFTFVTFGVIFVRALVLYKKNYMIRSWFKKLNEPLLQPKSKEHQNMVQYTKKFHKKLFWICLYLGVQTYLFFSLLPFLRNEISMLSCGWFPIDWQISPNYEIIYAFQNCVTLWNTIICLNLDTFSACLLSLIGLQCDYLTMTLNALDTFSVKNGLLQKNDESIIHSIRQDPPTFSRMMACNLKICIKHYQKVRELAKEIEEVHTISVFILFCGGGLIICSGLFQMTVVEIGTLEFFMFISFLMCMLADQFMHCWFGNEIIYKSNKISDAAFNTPWVECDLRYKKILLNFMIQAKYPIGIRVGGLISMSIATFKSVVQSAYSYFALLKKVQDN